VVTCIHKSRYSEALPILYASNTFDFRSLDTLWQFPTTILPQRLDMIRSINVRFSFRPGEKQERDEIAWRRACKALEGMRGLKRLWVILDDKREGNREKWWILQPLVGVRMEGEFVVRVTWEENVWEHAWRIGEWEGRCEVPFTLVRDMV
jgi:hypothetical protein